MKDINWMILLLVLVSCGSQTNISRSQYFSIDNKGHVWKLKSIGVNRIPQEVMAQDQDVPFVEFHIANKQMIGNDGCNNMMATIDNFNENKLKLGPLMGTKMACMDMSIPNLFDAALSKVDSYKITKEKDEPMQLHLYDQRQQELLVFIFH